MQTATKLTDLAYRPLTSGQLLLDLDLPPSERPVPIVVWLHGGGWMGGSKADRPAVRLVDEYLLQQGYAIASINYRLTGIAPFPAQLADARAAIRWLRAHASRYQLDPQRIGVWGFSSGGHLAALLGTEATPLAPTDDENGSYSSQVQAVCTLAAPIDLESQLAAITDPQVAGFARSATAQLLGTASADDPRLLRQASPLTYVNPTSAPFFLLNGDHDPLVPPTQMAAMVAALQAAKVPVTSYLIPGGNHGLGGLPEEEIQKIQHLIGSFFATYLA